MRETTTKVAGKVLHTSFVWETTTKVAGKILQIKAPISGLWPCGLSGHPPFCPYFKVQSWKDTPPLNWWVGHTFVVLKLDMSKHHSPPTPLLSLFPKSSTLDDMMIWSWPLDFQFGWLDSEYGFKIMLGTTFISTILNSILNSWFNGG